MANRGNSEYDRLDAGQPENVFSKNSYDAMTYELLYYTMSKIRGQFVLMKWDQEKFINIYC